MTELERKLKAKIPGEDTGIEVKRSICDICSPGPWCGVSAYVKDGELLKVEGLAGNPISNGHLCPKGAANRQYIYRPDRIQTPLRRVGPRGSGEFEAISWEEAYAQIARELSKIKGESGPEAVAFYSGYPKWYRPYLQRLTYAFGSPNYGTESSSCHMATELAWKTMAGRTFMQDLGRSKVLLGWGCNPFMNAYPKGNGLRKFKERGGILIIIDPRKTPTTQQLADLHLQLRPGTDGALALGLANVILQEGWEDREYIGQYVHGFEQFKACVSEFTLERTAEETGLRPEDIREAARLYATSGPASIWETAAAITHHLNGYNNYRAMIALQAITGNIDRAGGTLPEYESLLEIDCGFDTREEHFRLELRPEGTKERIGAARFPIWAQLTEQDQMMDFPRQVREGQPYPLKALVAFGLNHRMFPRPGEFLQAVEQLDFVVATDLFLTESCKRADIVLPACSSLERSELKGYGGGFLTCTEPAIPPRFQSKCDGEIICGMAQALGLDPEGLGRGYEACMQELIADQGLTLAELRAASLPVKVPHPRPYEPGTLLKQGFDTPTGKIELWSERIAALGEERFHPLPVYTHSFDGPEDPALPLTLITGARLPGAIHSRFHAVPWARSIRGEPAADLHPEDARRLGIREGDRIRIQTRADSVTVLAHLTEACLPGNVHFYHGYAEADANELLGRDHLDPYSGFPGYLQLRCAVTLAEGGKRA